MCLEQPPSRAPDIPPMSGLGPGALVPEHDCLLLHTSLKLAGFSNNTLVPCTVCAHHTTAFQAHTAPYAPAWQAGGGSSNCLRLPLCIRVCRAASPMTLCVSVCVSVADGCWSTYLRGFFATLPCPL